MSDKLPENFNPNPKVKIEVNIDVKRMLEEYLGEDTPDFSAVIRWLDSYYLYPKKKDRKKRGNPTKPRHPFTATSCTKRKEQRKRSERAPFLIFPINQVVLNPTDLTFNCLICGKDFTGFKCDHKEE